MHLEITNNDGMDYVRHTVRIRATAYAGGGTGRAAEASLPEELITDTILMRHLCQGLITEAERRAKYGFRRAGYGVSGSMDQS